MKPRWLLTVLPLALACLAWAADEKYPKVNTAITYVVDPKWPHRPDNAKWAEMSGIAVDAKDHIYIFTRATPPVQVYDADGKYLRGWGQDDIKSAHHIKIGPDGNVWVADIG